MNANEVCVWLNAAEQTQQPALVNLWAISKGGAQLRQKDVSSLLHARTQIQAMLMAMNDPSGRKKGTECSLLWAALKSYLPSVATDSETASPAKTLDSIFKNAPEPKSRESWDFHDKSFGAQDSTVRGAVMSIADVIDARMAKAPITIEQTADKPLYFDTRRLDDPAALEAAASIGPGERSVTQFLQGLQLRIQNRRTDRRWRCFYNYEDEQTKVPDAASWFKLLGIDDDKASPFTVIDCSMLSHEVLPYVCGIVGRMLLELREYVGAQRRFEEPWVIVLEEAHNYVRPSRQDEPRGIKVSRESFERIAKEGRKFGLSLVVASQRPAEISQTILSQCANFVAHRLQNPDDIEHFRQIVPSQTRRLFDQITILRAGEAIVLGSAFFVPSRVQIEMPDPVPASRSSTPYFSWRDSTSKFGFSAAIANWIGSDAKPTAAAPTLPSEKIEASPTKSEKDRPVPPQKQA